MYHSCLIHTLLIIIVSCSTSTSHHHQLISPPSDLRYPQSCHLILLKQPVILHGILQQVRGRASQPRLPASRFFTTGRSCRWSPTKTWLLWLGEIWQISLSNFGRSSSWFKTHIPKTKVITLNTSTFFLERGTFLCCLVVLSQFRHFEKHWSKEMSRFFALNLSMAVSQS